MCLYRLQIKLEYNKIYTIKNTQENDYNIQVTTAQHEEDLTTNKSFKHTTRNVGHTRAVGIIKKMQKTWV
jgi:hypothetical protein